MRIFLFAIAIALASPAVPLAAPDDPYAIARAAMRKAVDSKQIPSVSVAVFRNGKVDWEESYGWADRERGLKATPHTAYSLASVSKTFTATGLMTLVAKGKIDLDRPVNDYLGSAKVIARVGEAKDATVRRVANHTSGLPFHAQFFYFDTPYRRPAPDVTVRKYGQLISRPGERYFYSNLGFGILGEVIARRSGEPFPNYMQEAVFAPLHLTETAVGAPTQSGVAVAARYTPAGARLPDYNTDHAGASELYSSAHDLIRFAAFHLKAHRPDQHPILSDALIDAMHINTSRPTDEGGYGIGFSTSTRGGYALVSHSGGMPGVSTDMILAPAQGVAIVVLTNTWPSSAVDTITDKIAAAVLPGWSEEPPPPPARIFRPPPALVGRWVGFVAREEGELPATLIIKTDGTVEAVLGDQAAVSVKDLMFAKERLGGSVAASLQTRDSARYAYTVRLDMKLEGDRLYGGAVALDNMTSPTFVAGLTHWIDLHRAR